MSKKALKIIPDLVRDILQEYIWRQEGIIIPSGYNGEYRFFLYESEWCECCARYRDTTNEKEVDWLRHCVSFEHVVNLVLKRRREGKK